MEKEKEIKFDARSELSARLADALGFIPESYFVASCEGREVIHISGTSGKPEEWASLLGAVSRLREFDGKRLTYHGFDGDRKWVVVNRTSFEKRDSNAKAFDEACNYSRMKFSPSGEVVKD